MKKKMSVFLAMLLMLSLVFSFGASATEDTTIIETQKSYEANVLKKAEQTDNAETTTQITTEISKELEVLKKKESISLGNSIEGTLSKADDEFVFNYSAEGQKGYVCFALDAENNTETVKGGWIVEICDAEGKVLRSTTAALDEEGKLPKSKKFACADINGTYTVKVKAADENAAPVGTEFTVEAEQVYKFKGIFDKFLGFDLSVFEWIQSIQNKFLTSVMVVITTLGDEGIIFIAMGIVFLFTKKYRKVGVAVLTALVVMLLCNNIILKDLLARPRPFNLYNIDPEAYAFWGGENAKYFFPNLVHQPSSYSFPSGHTSSAFAAAFAILIYNRKIGIPMTFFAALMGLSRIYVEVHYCTDVIAGAIVALVYALIAAFIVKLIYPIIEKILDAVLSKFKKEKKA